MSAHKTKIVLEVLSVEEILPHWGLEDIVRECIEGNFSMKWDVESVTPLTKEETRKALEDQGSDPDFLHCWDEEEE